MTRAFDDTKNAVTPAKPAPWQGTGPVPMVDMGLGLRRESEERDALLNHPMRLKYQLRHRLDCIGDNRRSDI